MIARNKADYAELLRSIAKFSRLFSDNDSPYIDSRFVERVYAFTTGGQDIGRADCSFDVKFDSGEGVGVKTFLASSGDSKLEKIAEFNTLARKGEFEIKDRDLLVARVASARNGRLLSDAVEFGIDLTTSFYHALVRFPHGACVHEEDYQLIDLENLRPTRPNGSLLASWSDMGSSIYFTDGQSQYGFNMSKSVLFKRFNFDRARERIDLPIHPNPIELLIGRKTAEGTNDESQIEIDRWNVDKGNVVLEPGIDYVVLPLYSTRTGKVPKASGINQWNAGGRSRKFGEAYVPIPTAIHQGCPGFFPPRDTSFSLRLPNSKFVCQAKVCQEGGKALMTDPNFVLGQWLIGVLDPSIPREAFNVPVFGHTPFTDADLRTIGKDSIRVTRQLSSGQFSYQAEFAPLGAYENFLDALYHKSD